MAAALLQRILFLGVAFTAAPALRCHGCSGSVSQSDCESDVKGITDGKYGVNCSQYDNPNLLYCSLELVKLSGKVLSIIRECSDGVTFSFDQNSTYKKFQNLNKNNITVCMFKGNLICITLCKTDFCNGPSSGSEAKTSGGFRNFAGVVFVLWLLLACVTS